MKLFYLPLTLALLALALPLAQAQERVANGATSEQTTWTALANQLHGIETKNQGVGGRVELIEACGKRGMLFAQGVPGADSQNCIAPVMPPDVINSINNLNNTINNSNTNISKILSCNSRGMNYNGATGACVAIITPASVVRVQASSQPIAGNGKYASYAVATCPAGSSLIGCSGARNPSITDTCGEESCGLIGYGPINDNSCMATVDDGDGTRATVWATCLKSN